jgi:hypothetical protein
MDINKIFEQIISLYDSGGNPSQMMASMVQANPNINQFSTQFNNMTKGMTRNDAYMQIAKQLGLNEKNIQGLARMLGVKK